MWDVVPYIIHLFLIFTSSRHSENSNDISIGYPLKMEITVNRYDLFIYVCLNVVCLVKNTPQTREHQLIEYIFKNHSVDARPITNSSHQMIVKFGIELVQLITVNERSQFITTKLWVRQFWQSDLMRWNPKDWGGVNQLNMQAKDVWKPDIVLYNNAEGTFSGSTEKFKTLITVYPNGINSWLAPATFSSTCKMNVKKFPFDSQTCKMKFGSWAFDATKLNLTAHAAPLLTQQYLNSSTWDIVHIKTQFNSVLYNCCTVPFQDLTFTFVFRRRPLYYVFNVIAPCIVLVSMVLFSFFLPAESGERLSLNITVMLALAVFLQFLSDALPRNSDSTPILSVFFITLMSESAVALVTTILVLAIHHKGDESGALPPPRWTRKLFLHISLEDTGYKTHSTMRLRGALHSHRDVHQYEIDIDNDSMYKSVALLKHVDENIRKYSANQEDIIVYSLQDILQEINKINQSIQGQDHQDEVRHEWKMLGKALDRLFFLLFLTVFVASAIGTLLEVYGHVDMLI